MVKCGNKKLAIISILLFFISTEVVALTYCEAARKDNISEFKKYYFSGQSLETECGYGVSALYWAVYSGSERVVRFMLEHGANPNQTNYGDGSTALEEAVKGGRYEIAYALMNAGANANQLRPGDDHTPLFWAIHDYTDSSCSPRLIKTLLKNGASVNETFWGDENPLMRASKFNCVAGVKIFLENNADVNYVDSFGNTALTSVFENKEDASYDIAKLLLERGATVDFLQGKSGIWGQSPLVIAPPYADKHIMSLFLDIGINPNVLITLNNNRMPMDFFYKGSLSDALNHGGTLLMIAASYGNKEVVELLLEKGAEANYSVKGENGNHTAKRLALENGHTNIADML